MTKHDTPTKGELYSDIRLGGIERWYYGKPEDADMRIPRDIVKSVCFLCVKAWDEKSSKLYDHFIGTAFFVSVYSPESEFVYLATAKHVLSDARNEGYSQFFVRLNMRDGDSETIPIPDGWIEHDNKGVDIAVLPFSPNPDKFSYFALPLIEHFRKTYSFFDPRNPYFVVTKSNTNELEVGIGDDLFVAGLLSFRWGEKTNIPIVRSGIIAAMPDEPLVHTEKGVDYDYQAYLAEMRSIGGLSGSPVFVLRWRRMPSIDKSAIEDNPALLVDYLNEFLNAEPTTHFLGMIRGHWDLKRQSNDSIYREVDAKEIDRLNAGVAIITPAWDILEVLDGKELMKQREEADRERREKRAPTLDSNLPPKHTETKGITPEGFEDALKRASRKILPPDEETKER